MRSWRSHARSQEKGQFLFTPPVQVLYALREAINELSDEGGVPARQKRYHALYQLMSEEMYKLGLMPLVERVYHSRLLTAFHAPKNEKFKFDDMHDYLYERGFTIYPGKLISGDTFRIANIGDLTLEDMQSFVNAIKYYLNNYPS